MTQLHLWKILDSAFGSPSLLFSDNSVHSQDSSNSVSSFSNFDLPLWSIVLISSACVAVVVALVFIVWHRLRNRSDSDTSNVNQEMSVVGITSSRVSDLALSTQLQGIRNTSRPSLEQITQLSFNDETELPPHFSKHFDASGHVYYFNSISKTSHWTLPENSQRLKSIMVA